jgi:sugar phosphate isomerase/epimerase
MRRLGLHQITAIEAPPPELVSIAAKSGCQAVCVFVESPLIDHGGRTSPLFPTVGHENCQPFKERLVRHGITVWNVEYFPLEAETDIGAYQPAIALGAELGAARLVTHVHDTNEQRACDSLGRLCDLAATEGLAVGLEFMGLSPGCNSLAKARRLFEAVAAANLGIAVDALHMVRTGSPIEEVAALPPHIFAYAQLCDGTHLELLSDYLPEAMDRLAPGEGVFPLREFLRALPPDIPIDVEVPSERLRKSGVPPLERVLAAVEASRILLNGADEDRLGASNG